MPIENPILVTGAHRSGSTWLGRMLSLPSNVGYIHQPFNKNWPHPGVCRAHFPHWFPYVTARNEDEYYPALRDTLSFRYDLMEEVRAQIFKQPKGFLQFLFLYAQSLVYRVRGARPLMKDPVAIFSAEWLADRFDMDVVVLIRHPAAFAGSLKKKGWTHPFEDFVRQPALMNGPLAPFNDEIQTFSNQEHDVIDQAILLWRLTYHVVRQYRERHDDWIFVRHGDLSRSPVRGFKNLYECVQLPFSPGVEEQIRHATGMDDPQEASHNDSSLVRDSKANIWSWKDRLTDAEIAHVREKTADVAGAFYDDEDW